MTKILIPSSGPQSWKAFLAEPDKQWKFGYSAMAAAHSWEDARGLPDEIANIIGGKPELLLAIPEHKVPLPGGRRGSQCDVFALVRKDEKTISLAVEAKVNEPFGGTIDEWFSKPSKGKVERLKAICDAIECDYLPPGGIRYQLLHRTAAAVIEANRFNTDAAAMIVHSFSQEHQWYEDFAFFCDFLGVTPQRGKLVAKTLANGKSLFLGWATGNAKYIEDETVQS